jgi:hypothetical protein
VLPGSYASNAAVIGLLALAISAAVAGLGALLGPAGVGTGGAGGTGRSIAAEIASSVALIRRLRLPVPGRRLVQVRCTRHRP